MCRDVHYVLLARQLAVGRSKYLHSNSYIANRSHGTLVCSYLSGPIDLVSSRYTVCTLLARLPRVTCAPQETY